jgi:hypothetical protein
MKAGRRRSFWSLRPIVSALALQRASGVAAALLAVALFVTPPAGSRQEDAPAIAAEVQASQPINVNQRCMQRILERAADESEEAVAHEITQQCMTPARRQPLPLARTICARRVSVAVIPDTRQLRGCLGN